MRNTNSIQVDIETAKELSKKIELFKKLMGCEDVAAYITLRKSFMTTYADGTPYEAVIIEERLTDDFKGIEYRNQVIPITNKLQFSTVLIMKKEKYGE